MGHFRVTLTVRTWSTKKAVFTLDALQVERKTKSQYCCLYIVSSVLSVNKRKYGKGRNPRYPSYAPFDVLSEHTSSSLALKCAPGEGSLGFLLLKLSFQLSPLPPLPSPKPYLQAIYLHVVARLGRLTIRQSVVLTLTMAISVVTFIAVTITLTTETEARHWELLRT